MKKCNELDNIEKNVNQKAAEKEDETNLSFRRKQTPR